jgi:hypothetical protein
LAGETEFLGRYLPSTALFNISYTESEQESNLGRRGEKPVTNDLTYDTALDKYLLSKRYRTIAFNMTISAIWPQRVYYYHNPGG